MSVETGLESAVEPAAVRVIYLLGAGASKDAGLPLTVELFDRLELSFGESMARAESADERQRVENERALLAVVRDRMRAADSPFADPDNFELVAETVHDLRKMSCTPIAPFVSEWTTELDPFATGGRFGGVARDRFREFPRSFDEGVRMAVAQGMWGESEGLAFERLWHRMLTGMRTWVSKEFVADDLDYLVDFVRAVQGCDVFSLNYDVTIEEACRRAGVSCTTGFEKVEMAYPFPPHRITRGRWNHRLLDSSGKTVTLGKLHGSINWYRTRLRNQPVALTELDSQDVSESVIRDAESLHRYGTWMAEQPSPILFAGTGKLPACEPFLSLYRRFLESVAAADVLVVIGCRWQVEPIVRDAITSEVRRQPNPLRLLHVTGGSGDDTGDTLYGGARDAVLSGRLSRATQDLIGQSVQMRRIMEMHRELFRR
jgi:hypothetical protein